MSDGPGRISGHAGWGWGEYLEALVEEYGTLAAVAWKLFEQGRGDDDVGSIERALRRLRRRGQRDGGVWGDRLLGRFGMPRPIEDRLSWMGVYHSLFNDLPVAICSDQLRLWDFPPVSASPARVWLYLGTASLALRRRDFAAARVHYERVAAACAGGRVRDEARIEHALMIAYLESRTGSDAAQVAALESTERLVAGATLSAAHRHAHAACDHAGDSGYARLRVMGLILCARTEDAPAARTFLARARSVAARLGDEELAGRVERAAAQLGLG